MGTSFPASRLCSPHSRCVSVYLSATYPTSAPPYRCQAFSGLEPVVNSRSKPASLFPLHCMPWLSCHLCVLLQVGSQYSGDVFTLHHIICHFSFTDCLTCRECLHFAHMSVLNHWSYQGAGSQRGHQDTRCGDHSPAVSEIIVYVSMY